MEPVSKGKGRQKTVNIHQLVSFLKGVEILNSLSESDLQSTAKMCHVVRFGRAERIFSEHQPGGSLYVLMTGRVKIFGSSAQGQSKTFAFLEPGDFFGEMSLIEDDVRSASASALEDTVLIMLKAEDYRKLMLSRPSIAMGILKTMARRLRHANKEIEALSFNNVLGRIAQILLELAERYGKETNDGIQIDMPLSQRELSEMAGTAREVISRVISRFRKIGCVKIVDSKFIISDRDKLKSWVF